MYLISAIYYYTDVSFLCTCTKKPVGEDVYDVEEEEEEEEERGKHAAFWHQSDLPS